MSHQPVAIVTAAGRGIGAGVARALHARGWRLALMSPSGRAEALAAELGAVGLSGSVAEPDDLEKLVALTLGAHGRIDGVVNNTGQITKGDLLAITDQDWHQGLDMVVLNVIRLTRLVTPIMIRQGGGAIVNISSFSAFEPDLRFPLSSSLRAALGDFTKLYAERHGPDNIRMNSILAGFVDSEAIDAANIERIPLGRYGDVSEIGATAAFLLSPDASYLTGQNLRVDGGMGRSV
jgi:NAD(P)-dependent dehydrogenase (short-subunit alcohol dehydrogenase family)